MVVVSEKVPLKQVVEIGGVGVEHDEAPPNVPTDIGPGRWAGSARGVGEEEGMALLRR